MAEFRGQAIFVLSALVVANFVGQCLPLALLSPRLGLLSMALYRAAAFSGLLSHGYRVFYTYRPKLKGGLAALRATAPALSRELLHSSSFLVGSASSARVPCSRASAVPCLLRALPCFPPHVAGAAAARRSRFASVSHFPEQDAAGSPAVGQPRAAASRHGSAAATAGAGDAGKHAGDDWRHLAARALHHQEGGGQDLRLLERLPPGHVPLRRRHGAAHEAPWQQRVRRRQRSTARRSRPAAGSTTSRRGARWSSARSHCLAGCRSCSGRWMSRPAGSQRLRDHVVFIERCWQQAPETRARRARTISRYTLRVLLASTSKLVGHAPESLRFVAVRAFAAA